MKSKLKRTFIFLLIAVFTISSSSFAFAEVEPVNNNNIIASGTCGETVTWELRDDGVLTICGEGDVNAPLELGSLVDNVRVIALQEGITWVNYDIFKEFTNVEEITIPETVSGYFAEPSFISYFSDSCVYKLYKESLPDLFIDSDNKIYLSKNITEIRNAQDLISIADDLYGNYKLMNDIDMTGIEFYEIGEESGGEGYSTFKGILDGNGYSIKNVTVRELNNNSNIGLIEGNAGIIKNLTIENITISLKDNIYKEYCVGSVTGYNSGEILNCYCIGMSVLSPESGVSILELGGFAGKNYGIIKQCGNSGELLFPLKSIYGGAVGGIAGSNGNEIDECYNAIDIACDECGFGGITGYNSGTIKNCYNIGDLVRSIDNGTKGRAGGISGSISKYGLIENCFSIGMHNALYYDENCGYGSDDFYGIAENYDGGNIKNSFFLDDNKRYVFSNNLDEKKSIIEMTDMDTYSFYDFKDVWCIKNSAFPVLKNTKIVYKECLHNWNTEYTTDKESTCTEEGVKSIHCSDCNEVKDVVLIEKENHSYTDWVIDKTVTCSSNGSRHKECLVCGDIVKEETISKGHKWNDYYTIDKEATCKVSGSKSIHCANCNEIKDVGIIDKIPHEWNFYVVVKLPSCIETGLNLEKCVRCGELKNTVIPATGHTSKTDTTPATTSVKGETVVCCEICGAVLSTTTIPKIKTVNLKTTKFTYDGKAKKPAFIIKDTSGKTLKQGTDYTIKYTNNNGKVVKSANVGAYKAVVTFKGNYSGTVSKKFIVNPKGTAITKLTKDGKKQFTAKWAKRIAQVTGYEVRYSTKANMNGAKKVVVKNFKTNTKTIKNLKAKKKYWVQVRTYKTIKGVKYYSDWSKTRTVTAK